MKKPPKRRRRHRPRKRSPQRRAGKAATRCSAESDASERVYYVMAFRHLLPLALGHHYLRMPEAELMGSAMGSDDLGGLECWLVQTRMTVKDESGVYGALRQVADDFIARQGRFGPSKAVRAQSMPGTFLFVDHRVHDDPEDEFADIESAPLQSPDLVTVVIAGGAYDPSTADTHWHHSFRIVVEWVDSLRMVAAASLPAISDVESIHPVYLRVLEDSTGHRDVRNSVIHEAGVMATHLPIRREVTDQAAYAFIQRRLGNPSVLARDWTARAYSARALGDHSQSVLYAAIAAEQMIRHIACMLRWEHERQVGALSEGGLASAFDEHPLGLLRQLGERLGFESNWESAACPEEIRAWRHDIARVRNDIMHTGRYPTRADSASSSEALGNLGEYLADRVVANAPSYPISTLVLCGVERVRDESTRRLVLRHASEHDEHVTAYRKALAGQAGSAMCT